MRTLSSKEPTVLEVGRTYLVHVSINQLVTAKLEIGSLLVSSCCGVITVYKLSEVLRVYEYPVFKKGRRLATEIY